MLEMFGKPEVNKLNLLSEGIDHNIFRLDISMHDAFRMQILQSRANLDHDEPDLLFIESLIVELSVIPIVLAQIHLKVLKDQVDGLLSQNKIEQGGDILMFALS